MKQFLLSLSLLFTAHSMLAQESLTINVNTAGTLESLVEAANPEYLSQVKQLTVTGQLNGDDLAVLRNMAGGNDDEESAVYIGALRELDMSEAHIVKGGAAYHSEYSFAVSEYVDYYAEDDVVGAFLFNNCGRITSIKMPKDAKAIGKSAMSFCKNLTNIEMPTKNALTIGEDAFGNCANLKQVVIPANVTTIDDLAFNYCSNLKSVICCSTTAPKAFYKNEWENVFTGTNETYLRIYVPDGSSDSYKDQQAWNQFNIFEYSPDAKIGHNYDQINITLPSAGSFDLQFHYTYPDQEFRVKKLKINGPIDGTDVGIIRGMSSTGQLADLDLSDATIKKGGSMYCYYNDNYYGTEDNKITKYMFNSCYSLRNITLPTSVTDIDAAGTFADSLKTITVPAGNSFLHDVDGVLYSNADKALRFCPANREQGTLTVEDGTVLIADSACMANRSITALNLPTSLRTIGASAFNFCDSLKTLTVPEGVTEISDNAFCYAGLTEASLPSTLEFMGEYALSCPNLKTLRCYATVPPTVSTAEYAETFYNVSNTDCHLYVPAGTVETYNDAEGWNYFLKVSELSSTGIHSATAFNKVGHAATYTLDGRRAMPGTKGLHIVVDANGKVRKVMR